MTLYSRIGALQFKGLIWVTGQGAGDGDWTSVPSGFSSGISGGPKVGLVHGSSERIAETLFIF